MRISDFYESEPIKESNNYLWRISECHLPIKTNDLVAAFEQQNRIVAKYHFDPYVDNGDSCCTIGSLWFDGKPVMLFRHAGKRYDYVDEFITDITLYRQMLQYMESFRQVQEQTPYNVDAEIPELDTWYIYEITKENLGKLAHHRYSFYRRMMDAFADIKYRNGSCLEIILARMKEEVDDAEIPELSALVKSTDKLDQTCLKIMKGFVAK